MQLWKRNSWNLAIVILLMLVVINLASNLASAKNISIEYPREAYYGEEFNIKVLLKEYPEDTYSIKLDILTNQNRIAQVYNPTNEKYQSTYYYVNYIFEPNQDGVLLKFNITKKFDGEANINLKIRDSKGKVDELNGNNMKIITKETNKSINQEEEVKNVIVNEKVDKEIEKNETEEVKEEVKEEINNIELIDDKSVEYSNNTRVLYLNQESKDIKNQEDSQILFKSDNQKIREYAIIGFVFFCIILLILIIIERKK